VLALLTAVSLDVFKPDLRAHPNQTS